MEMKEVSYKAKLALASTQTQQETVKVKANWRAMFT